MEKKIIINFMFFFSKPITARVPQILCIILLQLVINVEKFRFTYKIQKSVRITEQDKKISSIHKSGSGSGNGSECTVLKHLLYTHSSNKGTRT